MADDGRVMTNTQKVVDFIVGSRFESLNDVGGLRFRCHHQDREIVAARRSAKLFRDVDAARARKHPVESEKAVAFRFDERHRLFSGADGVDLVALAPQMERDEIANLAFILDHENRRSIRRLGCRHRHPPCPRPCRTSSPVQAKMTSSAMFVA